MSGAGRWVTINGVHVFIDGKSGKITQGPAKFIGSTLSDLPSSKKSQSDLKAELKSKREKSSANKESSNSSPKVTAANDSSLSFARELTTQERKENEKFRSNAKELSKEVFKYDVSKFSDSELAKREKVLDKRLKERTGEKIDGDWRRDFCELNDIKKELKSRSNSSNSSNSSKSLKSSVSNTGNKTFDNATKTKSKSSDGGITASQEKEINRLISQGMSGNEAYKAVTTGKYPTVQTDGGAVAPTSTRNSAPVMGRTGNSKFDNATKTTKKTTNSRSKSSIVYNVKRSDGTVVKMNNKEFTAYINEQNKKYAPKASTTTKNTPKKDYSGNLTVQHYDYFGGGSRNVYKIDGKTVTKKEAMSKFPSKFDNKGNLKNWGK